LGTATLIGIVISECTCRVRHETGVYGGIAPVVPRGMPTGRGTLSTPHQQTANISGI
jgi:hypothetical protein